MQLQLEEQHGTVSDLEVVERLCEVGDRCIQGGSDSSGNLQVILDAAIFVTAADKGTMQLYDPDGLVIVAQQGFERPFLDFHSRVHEVSATTCGAA